MMKHFSGLITGLGLLALANPVQAIPTLDTLTTWDGITTIGSFGEPNSATYGQTFTVMGPETQLDSFTFLINDLENPDVINFQAFVYAWDGTRISGSALFSSSNLSSAADADVNAFESFTINIGGVGLNEGDEYVAFFSSSNLFNGNVGTGRWAVRNDNPYADGTLVFANNGADFSNLFSADWVTSFTQDLAFTATFSAPQQVPEPSTLAALGIGLLTIGALARRRRQA